MAMIKVDEGSYATARDLTLDIHWFESRYPDDDSYYECKVTFPVPHLSGENVIIDYTSNSQSEIMPRIAQDIMDYLDDPKRWTEAFIKKGITPILELRQLEKDLAAHRKNQEQYQRYTIQETERIERVEREIAAHKTLYHL